VCRKNVTKGYSEAQVKVRKATSNEAWGPEGADMAEIAQMTFDRYQNLDDPG
jgi:epsin